MPIIVAEQLSKYYPVPVKEPGLLGTLKHFVRRSWRSVEAVQDVSFSIEPGEIVGFLGPNGAGKTTTLKMLTGLVHPSRGRVEVAGYTPFERRAAFLKKITLVMGQKEQLIWDLPAQDSLRLNAAVYEIPEQTFRRRVDELAEILELGDKLTQPIRKLSLGERMKAELLAALLHRPEVLFLDEPTLGLDVNAQAAVRESLLEYNRRHRATVLLTSHYMADITALSHRVLLIHHGRLIYDGGLSSLLEKFAPYREVRVELEHPATTEQLKDYGEIEAVDGRQVRLLVQRATVTRAVSRLLKELPVIDLSVGEPPIEQVIGRVFQEGAVS